MRLSSISLHVIKMELKSPFITHLGVVKEREGILVEIEDKDGLKGYGECVAFSSPWYTEETISTCLHVLTDFLIPLLKTHHIDHPSEAFQLFSSIRRNNMAKASLEMALWDLFAKQKQMSLSRLLGGTLKKIPSGVVVGTDSLAKALKQIELYLNDGYERVKVKISPEQDYDFLAGIRKEHPDLQLMADANSAYTLNDISRLKALDEFNLLMIEQPLAHDDLIDHAVLQREISTPICLDESIVTFEDARKAIEHGSCKIINIKIGRVGGISEAIRIHDYCFEKGIMVWCGGMLEFGVSRAHNIALASLPGFVIPGDISATSRYWDEDIVFPEVIVERGHIAVPQGAGIGFHINEKRLQQVRTAKFLF